MSKQEEQQLPNYGPTDYIKFFGAGALAATLTHGVCSPCKHHNADARMS